MSIAAVGLVVSIVMVSGVPATVVKYRVGVDAAQGHRALAFKTVVRGEGRGPGDPAIAEARPLTVP